MLYVVWWPLHPLVVLYNVTGALIIGFATSFFSYYEMTWLKPRFGYDDSLDVFAVHGVSGLWGALATGLFAAPFINSLQG